MTIHARVSSVWQDITQIHTRVSGTWQSVKTGWVKVSGVWEQFFASFNITNPSATRVTFGAAATAYLRFNTDGTLDYTTASGSGTGSWTDAAPQASIGTGKYVRFVTSTGALTGGGLSAGVWYEITSARQFEVETGAPPDSASWTGTIQMSNDGVSVDYSIAGSISATADTI